MVWVHRCFCSCDQRDPTRSENIFQRDFHARGGNHAGEKKTQLSLFLIAHSFCAGAVTGHKWLSVASYFLYCLQSRKGVLSRKKEVIALASLPVCVHVTEQIFEARFAVSKAKGSEPGARSLWDGCQTVHCLSCGREGSRYRLFEKDLLLKSISDSYIAPEEVNIQLMNHR